MCRKNFCLEKISDMLLYNSGFLLSKLFLYCYYFFNIVYIIYYSIILITIY